MTKRISLIPPLAAALILLAALAVLLVPIKTPFNIYDEGFAVFNATRVLRGEIPYRDFWAIYPPGQFYALAALFKVFGTSLLVSRLYDTVVRFAIALFIWLIARKTTSPPLAYAALAIAALLLGSAGFYAYAVFPAIALGLLAILCLLAYTDSGRRAWLITAGGITGLAAFVRWDIGLYAGVSVAAALTLFHLWSVAAGGKPPATARAAASDMAVLAASALAIALVCYGAVGMASGFGPLWDQVVAVPATLLHEVRWLPYPPLFPLFPDSMDADFWPWLHFYAPLLIYVLAFGVYALRARRSVFDTRSAGRVATTIFGLLLFAQALSRYDYIHAIPTSILASLVVLTLASPDIVGGLHRAVRPVYVILLAALAALYVAAPVRFLQKYLDDFPPLACYSQIERASCVPVSPDQAQAVRYLSTHAQPDELIFVGNQRHDLIFVNDIGFYFLAAHPSASRYSELYPGVATTLDVQQSIVQELASQAVRWVVLVNIGNPGEPNASADSSDIVALDEFIRSNFRNVAEFGAYQIWEADTAAISQ